MEIVFIGLALSVCCFGIWRYGKTMRRGGCCGSGAVSPVKRRVADRDETHYPYTAVLTIDGVTKARKTALEHLRKRYPGSELQRWREAFRLVNRARREVGSESNCLPYPAWWGFKTGKDNIFRK